MVKIKLTAAGRKLLKTTRHQVNITAGASFKAVGNSHKVSLTAHFSLYS